MVDGGLTVEAEHSVHGVVAEEIREIVGGDQIVHADDLDAVIQADAIDEATDATETVDTDANGHVMLRVNVVRTLRIGAAECPSNVRMSGD